MPELGPLLSENSVAEMGFAHSEGRLVTKEANTSAAKVIGHAAKFKFYNLPLGHACEIQGCFNYIVSFK